MPPLRRRHVGTIAGQHGINLSVPVVCRERRPIQGLRRVGRVAIGAMLQNVGRGHQHIGACRSTSCLLLSQRPQGEGSGKSHTLHLTQEEGIARCHSGLTQKRPTWKRA